MWMYLALMPWLYLETIFRSFMNVYYIPLIVLDMALFVSAVRELKEAAAIHKAEALLVEQDKTRAFLVKQSIA